MRHARAASVVALVLASANAQGAAVDAPRPPVAIELLLREPRVLDADRVRQRWARIVAAEVAAAPGDTPWLRAAADGLEGAARGVRWQATAAAAARALDDRALRHLDDELRAALRAHRAHVVLRAPDAGASADARASAFRVLAGVAAALLARDVVAIGAAEHGTFDPVDELPRWRELLTGDDPLAALAPTTTTSLVALVRERRELVEADVERALAKELGVPFGGDAPNFAAVKGGAAAIRIGDTMVFVTDRPAVRQPGDDGERYTDLRLREAWKSHRGLLHVATAGLAEDAAEAERRRTVARVVAALWSDDVLALSWHCDRRLVPALPAVPGQLRAADPVAATLGDPPVPILEAKDADAMAKAIAAARASWATAVAHHRAGGRLSAKFRFATRRGGGEHVWITVTAIDGDTVRGTVDNEPFDIEGLELGATVTCTVAELSDWLFERDGKRVGGHTLRALDADQRPAK
jgi:uncharacterized protein YegJ (DUF2314 family)